MSRQAISRWEMDGAVPEVDKLIALSRLFGVSLNDLLQVNQEEKPPEEPTPARPTRKEKWTRRWLAALTALCILLTGVVGLLWGETRQLTRRLAAAGEVTNIATDKPLFESAICQLGDLELGFQQAHGSGTLEVHLELEPVPALKGWEFLGLEVVTTGHDPWARPGQDRDWSDSRSVEVSRKGLFQRVYTADLSFPQYGGEQISLSACFREKDTGLTAGVEDLFVIACDKSTEGLHTITGIKVLEEWRTAFVPRQLELQLPDPRFD